jgi:hypothetical protein
MGAQGSVFRKDPFAAWHELSVTHKTDVPLGAIVDMTVFIERGRIARGADNTYFVGSIHKSKFGSLLGIILPALRTPCGGGSP